MRITIAALAALIVLSTVCYGDPDNCYNTAGLSCPSMQINVCPRADFELIRMGGGAENDYIWIVARDLANNPIPGIPWTDYWLNACTPSMQLWLCAEPIVADSLTGINGRTTFSGVIRAGGCVPSGGVYMAIQGKPVLDPAKGCLTPVCLSIVIKGPDITGPGGQPDGAVGLADLTAFGTSFNTLPPGPYPPGKAYNPCCDYTDDGICNLGDFGLFGQHFQHVCF